MHVPFHVEVEVIDNGASAWKTARVDIFQTIDGRSEKIGSYPRNHAGWCTTTFCPFMLNGRWYALYAPDYTATRVMELPSCRDIAGEDAHTNGFCPVDYYVPYNHPRVVATGRRGHFGFVAGCIWGDDSSWKIQFLDLGAVDKGVLVRKELFGYVAMSNKSKALADCISLDSYYPPEHEVVDLAVEITFDLRTGEQRDPF